MSNSPARKPPAAARLARNVRPPASRAQAVVGGKINGSMCGDEIKRIDFFDHAPIGMLWADPSGRILQANRLLARLVGRRMRDCVGLRLQDIFEDSFAVAGLIQQLTRGGSLHDVRARLKRKGDGLIPVLIDANVLRNGGKIQHSRWFIRDNTRRVEMEKEILNISEREQRRIGQDLHDDLCQELACIEFLCQALHQKLNVNAVSEAARAAEIASMVRQAIRQTRELARGLSPVAIEADGLMHALRRLANRTTSLYQVGCVFHCPKPVLVRDNTLGINLFRIAQEAVGNALRHGQARQIEISLATRRRRTCLTIKDDGQGLPGDRNHSQGMGLQIMQYRAAMINGHWAMESRPGGGVTVTCSVPARSV